MVIQLQPSREQPMSYGRKIIVGTACIVLVAGLSAGKSIAAQRPLMPVPKAKQDCSTCHQDSAKGALKKPLSALCLDCHPDRMGPNSHRVDMVPARSVGDLPLFKGQMTCATCHDPHRNTYGALLRKPATKLCLTCHPV